MHPLGSAASLLQFLPLSIFVCVAFPHGEPYAEDWLNAFLAGGVMAVLQLVLVSILLRLYSPSRLVLGVNAYLIFGGALVLANQESLLLILDDLKESGVFLSILMICIIAFPGFGDGLLGLKNGLSRAQAKRHSLWLLALAFVAAAVSFYFRGNLIFSAVIPLVTLAIADRLMKNHARRTEATVSSLNGR